MKPLRDILNEVKPIVLKTGAFIRNEFTQFKISSITHKGLHDLVSYVDVNAEKTLVDGLTLILPEAGFICEESTSTKKGDTFNWIIDPLDGTTNFVHGIPAFAISIALQKNNATILGVVYEINRDEFFCAIEGEGAYMNDKPITVTATEELENTLLATGFPYTFFEGTDTYLSILKEFMQKTHGIRRIGSAAVDLAYVACGRFDGFFEYNLNAWDVAGGALIVKEAGGKVTEFNGGESYVFDKSIVASNGKIHVDMLDVLKRF